jgi:predicted small secreted protein
MEAGIAVTPERRHITNNQPRKVSTHLLAFFIWRNPMREKKIAVTVAVAATILLAACNNPIAGGGVDTKPIGNGIEFLGMCLVLAALIIAFSKGGGNP